jgi:hypothetical protein
MNFAAATNLDSDQNSSFKSNADKNILNTFSTSNNSLNSNKNRSPQSERQLSYLKLACLVNGYDSFNNNKNNDSKIINENSSNMPINLINNLNIDIKINIEPKTENSANKNDESDELVNNRNVKFEDSKQVLNSDKIDAEQIDNKVNNDVTPIENSSDIKEDASKILVQVIIYNAYFSKFTLAIFKFKYSSILINIKFSSRFDQYL